jgi:hypothetical protein
MAELRAAWSAMGELAGEGREGKGEGRGAGAWLWGGGREGGAPWGGLLGELGPRLVHELPVGDCCLVRAVCRKKTSFLLVTAALCVLCAGRRKEKRREEGEKKKKKGKEKRRKIKIKFFQPKNFQGEK